MNIVEKYAPYIVKDKYIIVQVKDKEELSEDVWWYKHAGDIFVCNRTPVADIYYRVAHGQVRHISDVLYLNKRQIDIIDKPCYIKPINWNSYMNEISRWMIYESSR